jgi:apolipoprotein D and lipocalin family protein
MPLRCWVVTGLILLLAGCIGMPDGVEPVQGFDAERYLGRWYEIARLDHSFERGLEAVYATYEPREDGGIRVINRGYDSEDGEWKEAVGKAYFVEDADTAHLKVSFFGPFYGSYVVFDLDPDYDVAYVSGYNSNYLWLLSRRPEVSETIKEDFRRRAASLGFDTGALVWVDNSRAPDT